MAKKTKKAAPKAKAGNKPRTKSELMASIAEHAGITKKQAGSVLEALTKAISQDLKKVGQFTMAGVCKMKVQHKPATKARKGVNPFTGESMMFKAKPARNVVRIRPLKALKESV